MSDTGTSRSKTTGRTVDSGTTEDTQAIDRWSYTITYRQLVMSSCIGIVQLWWHPYLQDLQRLVPFIFAYNFFSLVVGYPLFYLELAIGVVTKKGITDCWDMSPMARGVSIAMLGTCLLTALAFSKVAAWCLALFVHSFHVFLPWLHCAAIAVPACAARHRPLNVDSETPPQSFFFNFVLQTKRDQAGSLGTIVPELAVYYGFGWVLIYCIVCKRIYSYSKLVLFKDVMACFVVVCCVTGASRLEGAGTMFALAEWKVLYTEPKIWLDAMEYSLLQMSVCQGSLIMLGTYCPKQQHKLGRTALASFLASKATSMLCAFALGATHGALRADYYAEANIVQGASASLVVWADLMARIPGSQFWSAIVFFTLFVLALSSTALLIQTIMSTATGHTIRKIRWAILIAVCLVLCVLGILLCTQIDLDATNFIMHWSASKPRLPVGATMAFVVTYVYGQTTFCEDVYFAVGEYPNVFMRVCWAVMPVVLIISFAASVSSGAETWPEEAVSGVSMVFIAIAPIFIAMFCYSFFKFRVRNILTDK